MKMEDHPGVQLEGWLGAFDEENKNPNREKSYFRRLTSKKECTDFSHTI